MSEKKVVFLVLREEKTKFITFGCPRRKNKEKSSSGAPLENILPMPITRDTLNIQVGHRLPTFIIKSCKLAEGPRGINRKCYVFIHLDLNRSSFK